MKNESPLAIVQTAALCLIAVLLLILTLSGGASASARPAIDPMQELATLCQIAHYLDTEFEANAATIKSFDVENPRETEKVISARFTERNEILGKRIDALNELINEKSQAIPQPK